MSKKLSDEDVAIASHRPAKLFGFSSFTAKAAKLNQYFVFEDHIQLIEGAINFSTLYSTLHSPEQDIIEGKISSVVFKVSEDTARQTVTYHFWKKTYSDLAYYTIIVSTKDRQVNDLEYKDEGSIPAKFFKITDDNKVDIVAYQAPRL